MLDTGPKPVGLGAYWSLIRPNEAATGTLYGLTRVAADLEPDQAAHVWGMTEPSLTPLLTTEQLGDILQVPPRTLEDWRTRDYGPKYLRLGKRVRYRAADVDLWLQAQGAA